MSETFNKIEKRIRFSGLLIFVALLLEAAGLMWLHPAAFLLIHMTAMLLFFIAVAVYLFSLVPE
jgi:hypothetical protein